eukprot:scaffold91668_cov17-Prasinocladus_malaysianus.AAC.1
MEERVRQSWGNAQFHLRQCHDDIHYDIVINSTTVFVLLAFGTCMPASVSQSSVQLRNPTIADSTDCSLYSQPVIYRNIDERSYDAVKALACQVLRGLSPWLECVILTCKAEIHRSVLVEVYITGLRPIVRVPGMRDDAFSYCSNRGFRTNTVR